MKTLITTTIHVPHVLTQWGETMNDDDFIIVAGDLKTPHEETETLLRGIRNSYGVNTEYLHPQSHRQSRWGISNNIGFNSVQRRNIALLAAMELRPDYIITVDDDNEPTTPDQLKMLTELFVSSGHVPGVQSDDGWYDAAGETLNAEDAWGFTTVVTHRGFPYDFRFVNSNLSEEDDTTEWPIGVAAMLWLGDPDIDAAERFTHRPRTTSVGEPIKLLPGTWCPFNSQATMFRGDLAPLMFVWPHVGRYDDIWGSFLTRRVMDHMGLAAYYGTPVVNTQDRNDHDIINDLQLEMLGMTRNAEVIAAIRGVDLEGSETPIHSMARVMEALSTFDILPEKTRESFPLWLEDLNEIGL